MAVGRGAGMACIENQENYAGQDEPVKVCPACGSEEVSIIKQEENGEIVCAADSCLECGHQWNVG